jgi:hypothetical protein
MYDTSQGLYLGHTVHLIQSFIYSFIHSIILRWWCGAGGYHEMLMGQERTGSADAILAWVKGHLKPSKL